MLLSHYDQNGACDLELVRQATGPKNALSLSVTATLTSRIWLSDQAGTHEYYVVTRERVHGELVDYEDKSCAELSVGSE